MKIDRHYLWVGRLSERYSVKMMELMVEATGVDLFHRLWNL